MALSASSNTPFKSPAAPARKKVVLKPGRSLIDWIRLTHSGKDLTSLQGKIKEVTALELSKHNTRDDAWISLKGKVYNITPYFEYHPGGEEELMRGVGKDATQLFNQIHRWVNVESMLEKCYIGPLKSPSMWLHSDEIDYRKLSQGKPTAEVVEAEPTPKYEWHQTPSSLHITVYTSKQSVKLHSAIIDLESDNLLIRINWEKSTYTFNMRLEKNVSTDYEVKLNQASNALEIDVPKTSVSMWDRLGVPLARHNSIHPLESYIHYRQSVLSKKIQINHNTFIFTFNLHPGTRMIVPLGHHVRIKTMFEGTELIRNYTPVLPSLIQDVEPSNTLLHFIIKIYENGIFTSVLKKCEPGETFYISDYLGDFSSDTINNCSSLILIAAGTGLTPMINVIRYALNLDDSKTRNVLLIFFNRTQSDIIWHDELALLSQKDERFQVSYALSEPDSKWEGATGYVTKELLEEHIVSAKMNCPEVFFCVCGPIGFTNATLRCLEELNYSKEKIHAFLG